MNLWTDLTKDLPLVDRFGRHWSKTTNTGCTPFRVTRDSTQDRVGDLCVSAQAISKITHGRGPLSGFKPLFTGHKLGAIDLRRDGSRRKTSAGCNTNLPRNPARVMVLDPTC